jgi:dipeptidyl aminopeptidase/acylaminoacyl peptidase
MRVTVRRLVIDSECEPPAEGRRSPMRKWSLPLICAISALFLSSSPSKAQSVFAKDGNVFLKSRSGQTKQLTTSGRDYQPCLSPDRRRILFVRHTPGKTVPTPLGDAEATELWLVDSDGKAPELVVTGREDEDPKKSLADFSSSQFSPDGRRIFFMSVGWVTSGAVHVVDIQTKRESFVSPGNTLEIIQKGRYRGYLIVQEHKYFFGSKVGSYDHYWLLTADGREVRDIGEERSYRNFKKRV